MRSWLIFGKSQACFLLFRHELVSCGFHRYQIEETLNLCFEGSIEYGTSSIIDLHMWFVYTGFQLNLEFFFF